MQGHEFLSQVSLFSGMSHEDLHAIEEVMEEITLQPGEVLFHEGDPGDHAYIIKQGTLEILTESNGREVLLSLREQNAVIGEMALVQSSPRTATVRARTKTKLAAIQKDDFDQMLMNSPSAMQAVFKMMLARYENSRVALQQSEKMAQLGTLTAGIAHELNNPAASVKRNASHLQDSIKGLDDAYALICQLNFDAQQWQILDDLSEKAYQSAFSPPVLDSLTRSDREDQIEIWLSNHQVEETWLIAPNLVNLNFNQEELATLADQFPAEKLPCLIDWLNATFTVYSLLNELSLGAGRISTIVKSLKDYTFLDQAPVQSVDVCEGLDNTLTMLHYKLKSASIEVVKEYAPDLPHIMAYGSELNQVWTNIIDNAIDALQDQPNPKIQVRARKESVWVVVEIEDNGAGIPKNVLPKIFDAFFTTKGPGKGTGLGLNISYSIVVQKHRGDVKVHSVPGKTVFEIWLPINFESE
ncbi:MAG: cyclic nucleotide-binding domain-containing protein [Anaerolineales bacterium]